MEAAQKPHRVCLTHFCMIAHSQRTFRRSHLQEGLKTKNWDLRMQMTQKKLAVKKLQEELRQEKDEELQRLVLRIMTST
jgi:hypothetical protein